MDGDIQEGYGGAPLLLILANSYSRILQSRMLAAIPGHIGFVQKVFQNTSYPK